MGIPYLFRYLVKRHPNIVVDAVSGGVDTLWIDFNSIVHGCAAALDDPLEDRVVAASVERVLMLERWFRPSVHTFVAVDGIPPAAKMAQQRKRRFVAVHRGGDARWAANAVTPGTPFMDRLSCALGALAAASDGKIVVSDASVQGEGEQKIFGEIRKLGTCLRHRAVVYGLDADLLLMSMSASAGACASMNVSSSDNVGAGPSITVAREQFIRLDELSIQLVDVDILADAISADVADACGSAALPAHADRVADFVALCGLLGNDFMPPLPGLSIAHGGMDALIRFYGEAMKHIAIEDQHCHRRRSLASSGPHELGGLDTSVLVAIASKMAPLESEAVRAAEHRQVSAIASYRSQSQSQSQPSSMMLTDDYPIRPGKGATDAIYACRRIRAGTPFWRRRYYAHLFRAGLAGGCITPDVIDGVVVAYVASMAWSAAYMRQRCLSVGWAYPHSYAPTVHDIAAGLHGSDLVLRIRALFESSDDALARIARLASYVPGVRGAWHLSLVLPPQSVGLVPCACGPVRSAIEGTAPCCAHIFPTSFTLQTYLCSKLHECHPNLPAMDLDLVCRALEMGPDNV